MLHLLPCAKFPSSKACNSNHHHSDKFPHPGHKSSTGPEIPANLWKFHLWISFVTLKSWRYSSSLFNVRLDMYKIAQHTLDRQPGQQVELKVHHFYKCGLDGVSDAPMPSWFIQKTWPLACRAKFILSPATVYFDYNHS